MNDYILKKINTFKSKQKKKKILAPNYEEYEVVENQDKQHSELM